MRKKMSVIGIGLLCFLLVGCGINGAMDISKQKAECTEKGCVWEENNKCICNN